MLIAFTDDRFKGTVYGTRGCEGQIDNHLTAFHGHKDVVEFLLAHGAEVNGKTTAGLTPLSMPLTSEFRVRAGGKDGKFSFSLSSPQLSPAYQVLVEKEGYLPTVSTNLFVQDGNQTLEFKLHKG